MHAPRALVVVTLSIYLYCSKETPIKVYFLFLIGEFRADYQALFSSPKKQKVFKISRHIESCGTYMKH